jgi:hypothetical protein
VIKHDSIIETAFDRNEKFVARFFGVSVECVRGWRKRQIGPPHRKIGGKLVRYSVAGLTAWAQAQPAGGQAA